MASEQVVLQYCPQANLLPTGGSLSMDLGKKGIYSYIHNTAQKKHSCDQSGHDNPEE
jgi:hypothetical protein